MEGRTPEATFRCGGCQASVWENERDRNGQTVIVKSVSFQRRYLDANDEWKTTNSLNVNDIPKAIVALQQAYEFIVLSDNQSETPF